MLIRCEERADVQLRRQAMKRSLARLITALRMKGVITIEPPSRPGVEVAAPRHDLHPLCVSPCPRPLMKSRRGKLWRSEIKVRSRAVAAEIGKPRAAFKELSSLFRGCLDFAPLVTSCPLVNS